MRGISLKKKQKNTAFTVLSLFSPIFLQNACPQGHSLWLILGIKATSVSMITNQAGRDWSCGTRPVHIKGCGLHRFGLQRTFLPFVVEGPSQCGALSVVELCSLLSCCREVDHMLAPSGGHHHNGSDVCR